MANAELHEHTHTQQLNQTEISLKCSGHSKSSALRRQTNIKVCK